MLAAAKERLAEAHEHIKHQEGPPTGELQLDRTQSEEPDTAYPLDELLGSTGSSSPLPRTSTCIRSSRRSAPSAPRSAPTTSVDWGQAEALAFATLLIQGRPLRLTGQDTARGTFSQRHLVLVDVKTGERYAPVQHLEGAKASFEIHNSPLSEQAARRLRVRLRGAGARDARDVGGAVRRLRERRPGGGGPVHRVRPRQVG